MSKDGSDSNTSDNLANTTQTSQGSPPPSLVNANGLARALDDAFANASTVRIPQVASMLGTFSGSQEEDIEYFLQSYDEISALGKWSPAEKLACLKPRLRDRALQFVVASPELREERNYGKFREKLVAFFKKKRTPIVTQREFSEVKQKSGETIRELAHRVTSHTLFFLNVKSPEDEPTRTLVDRVKMSKFLDALMPHIRVEVIKFGPTEFDSAVSIATSVEDSQRAVSTNPLVVNNCCHHNNANTTDINTWDQKFEGVRKDLAEHTTQMFSALAEQINSLRITQEQRNNTDKGTLQPDRQQPSQNRGNREAKSCSYCKRQGHWVNECFKKRGDQRRNQRVADSVPRREQPKFENTPQQHTVPNYNPFIYTQAPQPYYPYYQNPQFNYPQNQQVNYPPNQQLALPPSQNPFSANANLN